MLWRRALIVGAALLLPISSGQASLSCSGYWTVGYYETTYFSDGYFTESVCGAGSTEVGGKGITINGVSIGL